MSKYVFYLTGSYDDLVGDCTNTKITRTQTITISDETTAHETDPHETEIYEYVCFEKDVTWGYLSVAFMCVPGLFFWIFMSYKYSIPIFRVKHHLDGQVCLKFDCTYTV